MKKKLISVLLVGVLAVSMSAGCGQKEDAKKDTKVSSEKKTKMKEKKPEIIKANWQPKKMKHMKFS